MGIPENKTLEDRGALKIQNPRGPRTLEDLESILIFPLIDSFESTAIV